MSRLSPNLILSAVLITALSPVALLAQTAGQQAQDQPQQESQQAPDQQAPDQGWHHHAMNPHRQAKHMAKTLGLSADQESRIEPILANRNQQMEALHSDTTLSPDQRHQKMRSIMADTNSQISQVLTDQQNQQWQQMKAQHRGQRQQQGDPGDAPASAPTNQ